MLFRSLQAPPKNEMRCRSWLKLIALDYRYSIVFWCPDWSGMSIWYWSAAVGGGRRSRSLTRWSALIDEGPFSLDSPHEASNVDMRGCGC